MSLLIPSDSDALWSVFRRVAERAPDDVAVTTADGTLTFAEIESHAAHMIGELRARAIGDGDMVHIVLPNIPVFLPIVLAIRALNATVGLVSARYRDAEVRAVAHRVPPAAFLTTPPLAAVLKRALDIREEMDLPDIGGQPSLSLLFPSVGIPPRDTAGLAVVKFTSGSTGAPKGVGLTELNVLAEAANVVATLGIETTDRIVVPVPISHSYGFDLGVLPVLTAGAHAVMRRSFIPREVLADLAHQDTSVFLGVPSMYRILTETPAAEIPDLSHIRYMLSCTAPLLPDLIETCRERLGVSVCQHYGSSETGAAANHRPAEVMKRPGSVGVSIENVEIRIVSEQGAVLGPGEAGEITIRSRAVSPGYVTEEGPSRAVFSRVGEFVTEYRTGDIGVLDDDGFLYWRGRQDEVINVGGFKVYPSEVVQVLERCPGVSDARVIAGVDPYGEQVVHAVVALSQSTRELDILAYCRQHLADYKVPRRIEIVEAISRPEATKLSYLTGEI